MTDRERAALEAQFEREAARNKQHRETVGARHAAKKRAERAAARNLKKL